MIKETTLDNLVYVLNVTIFFGVIGAFLWDKRENVKWCLMLLFFVVMFIPMLIFFGFWIAFEEVYGYFNPNRYKSY